MSLVNEEIFQQLVDMDEGDPSHEFSAGILRDFFVQAQDCISKFHQLLKERNLDELAKLGHYLKGSSASVGGNEIKNLMEPIQYYTKYTTSTQQALDFIADKVDQLPGAIERAKAEMSKRLGTSL